MSKKNKSFFVCNTCGYQSLRWLGKCPECSTWGSLEEQIIKKQSAHSAAGQSAAKLIPLNEEQNFSEKRIPTGIDELNRVLGGGIVTGSIVMVGGDPGIGKSTIMLQMLDKMKDVDKKVYISGEESLSQIQQRARRLQITGQNIFFVNDTNLETILAALEKEKPGVVVIDSIQTIASENIDGIPGNSSQLRYCTAHLVQAAKQNQISIFLVGHVTKDGAIAGPKILEHIVDTVLYFEGDNQVDYRILRSVKNRFGAVNEIALFQMEKNGLIPVANPSEIFLNTDQNDRQGTAVVAVMEGNRPMLVEVQALVAKTQFGIPQRTATGIEHRRMNLLLAVLEKKCTKPFSFYDVFLKTADGLKLDEPATDLGICMALISSMDELILANTTVYIGEVGLNGELRPVSRLQERINEAVKLGFKRIVIPKSKNRYQAASANIQIISRLQKIVN